MAISEQVKISKILKAIRENKKFRTDFANKAEEIIDKVYSFYGNPNCTCKSAIIKWITDHPAETDAMVVEYNEYFKSTDSAQELSKVNNTTVGNKQPQIAPQNQNPHRMKMGEVEIIDATPEAYKELFAKVQSEKWIFRGFNIMPYQQDNGKEVWYLFFY